jgi:hypothetical protein
VVLRSTSRKPTTRRTTALDHLHRPERSAVAWPAAVALEQLRRRPDQIPACRKARQSKRSGQAGLRATQARVRSRACMLGMSLFVLAFACSFLRTNKTHTLRCTMHLRSFPTMAQLNQSRCWLQRGVAKVIVGVHGEADGEGEGGEGDRIERCLRAPVEDPRHVARRPLTILVGRNDSPSCGLPPSPCSSSGVAQTGFRPAEKHGTARDQATQVCAQHKLARLAPVRERAHLMYLET